MLREAVKRVERGLVDADLGGGVLKQRIARKGAGRSGGFRSLIVYRFGELSIFVFGFAKNEMDNIDADQLARLKELAALLLSYDEAALVSAAEAGELWEIGNDKEV